jgi:hypothetical protein
MALASFTKFVELANLANLDTGMTVPLGRRGLELLPSNHAFYAFPSFSSTQALNLLLRLLPPRLAALLRLSHQGLDEHVVPYGAIGPGVPVGERNDHLNGKGGN